MRTDSLPLPQMEGKALCRLRTIIRRKFEMTPKWNAQHPNGKQGFQPPATTIVIWTPQASTTAPHPMAASGCTPMVTMLNSPRMADLRSGGDRSCTADEEVTKREEVAKPAKRNRGPALPPPGWRLPRTVRIPSTGCLRKAWLPPCRFCVQTAGQRGCSPWLRLRPRPE